jgi:hypothetical protein
MGDPHLGQGGRSISGGFEAAILDKGIASSLIPTLTQILPERYLSQSLARICDVPRFHLCRMARLRKLRTTEADDPRPLLVVLAAVFGEG